jgi:L-malate glycosyltransferase
VRDALRAAGHRSEVFAEVIVDDLEGEAHRLEDFDRIGASADLLLYQASTGSASAEWLLSRDEPVGVNYHNVTPARFFDVWDSAAAANLRWGRNQVRALARRSVVALAASAFNAAELSAAGYQPVAVAPLLLDLAEQRPPADPMTADYLARIRSGAHWLFVGRIAPNKCQHDIIGAFAAYRRLYDPGARLSLIGTPASIAYRDSLLALADELGCGDAVDEVETANDSEVSAYYQAADVFVCLSQHEGFCVPIVEAMSYGTPVIALAAGAVPDTVGDAGILLRDADPVVVATSVHRLLADEGLRSRLVASGHNRVAAHDLERERETFVRLLLGPLDGRASVETGPANAGPA